MSVDYLVRPVEVFAEVARVLRPGGPFVTTFSNRCFPTKAIRGWLAATDEEHCEIVAGYFAASGGFDGDDRAAHSVGHHGDPLFAVWARRSSYAGETRRLQEDDHDDRGDEDHDRDRDAEQADTRSKHFDQASDAESLRARAARRRRPTTRPRGRRS